MVRLSRWFYFFFMFQSLLTIMQWTHSGKNNVVSVFMLGQAEDVNTAGLLLQEETEVRQQEETEQTQQQQQQQQEQKQQQQQQQQQRYEDARFGEQKTVFEDLLGDTLYMWGAETNAQGQEETAVYEVGTKDVLQGKDVIALYFSASWCGPCQQFTPILSKFYHEMAKRNKKFEVIWVSSDRTAEDFITYYQKMPWLAVPIPSVQRALQILSPRYQVKGIPHLVILDGKDASVYTLDGRTMVLKDQYGVEFPWRPKTLLYMLPGPIRSVVQSMINNVKTKLMRIVLSILESVIPKQLLRKIAS